MEGIWSTCEEIKRGACSVYGSSQQGLVSGCVSSFPLASPSGAADKLVTKTLDSSKSSWKIQVIDKFIFVPPPNLEIHA